MIGNNIRLIESFFGKDRSQQIEASPKQYGVGTQLPYAVYSGCRLGRVLWSWLPGLSFEPFGNAVRLVLSSE